MLRSLAHALLLATSADALADTAIQRLPTDTSVVAQVQTLDRLEAEQERLRRQIESQPKAYEDKVMDASTLPTPTGADDLSANANQPGFSSYFVESRFGVNRSEVTGSRALRAGEFGVRSEYRRETLNHGDLVLQADLRHRNGELDASFGQLGYSRRATSQRLTLRSLGFPITPYTFADSSVGDIYSEVTDAFRRSYRLSLGSSSVRGLSTRIFDRDFDLTVGAGQRGQLQGGPYPGFEASQGSLAWLGYTQRFGNKLYAGVQFNRATQVPAYNNRYSYRYDLLPGPGFGPVSDVSSTAASFGYGHQLFADGDKRLRVMLMSSQSSASLLGFPGSSQGLFIEAGLMAGRFRHEMGVYSAKPNLRFGDYTLLSDTRGAYWRVDHSTARLNWGAGLEYAQQNPNREPDRVADRRAAFSANVNYRLDRDTYFGGNLNASDTRYTSSAAIAATSPGLRSLNANVFYRTRFYDWGTSSFSATVYSNDALVANAPAATGEQLQWEHDWITGKYETMRPELTTSLGIARDRSSGATQTYPTAGVRFRYWIDADWNVSGNLNYSSRSGNLYTSRGLAGTLNTERDLGSGWRFGISASLNQAVLNPRAHPASLANMLNTSAQVPQLSRSNDKTLYFYLRWEGSSGTPYRAAGLRHGDAAGTGGISGIVYFDSNRDGEQQVGEAGVPDVEVFLDGRDRVTTDRDGRFEFPVVATGQHQLTLKLESVPLPWGSPQERPMSVDVPLRGQANVRIPVVRTSP